MTQQKGKKKEKGERHCILKRDQRDWESSDENINAKNTEKKKITVFIYILQDTDLNLSIL